IISFIRGQLFPLLEPKNGTSPGPRLGNTNLDKDSSGKDVIDATDIMVMPDIDADGSWEFRLLLHQDLVASTVPLQFDLGLGHFLTFDTTGGVAFGLGVDYLLDFTVDPTTPSLTLNSTNLQTYL